MPHILLVEDNDGDIHLTLEALEESKIKTEISVVKNGQEALDFLFCKGIYSDAVKPDLIVLDINIPIYNGHEVLSKIKSNDQLKEIPVIILSTSSHDKDISKAYQNHCNCYIVKPNEVEKFQNQILKIIEFWFQWATLSNQSHANT
ncbi:MAG: response regulator [Psychroflexus sp.]